MYILKIIVIKLLGNLPKDLREVNESQFKEVFDYLKKKTNDFTEITEEMLKEKPGLLFIFRIILCLSQSELAKLLKIDKQWVRHFESGRQGFKQSKNISKCVRLINRLLPKRTLDINIMLNFLRMNQFARNKNFITFPQKTIEFKRISEMSEEDFKNNSIFYKKKLKTSLHSITQQL